MADGIVKWFNDSKGQLTKALVKLDKLLEYSFENNQQPTRASKYKRTTKPRGTEGSETSPRAKAVMGPRTSRSCNKRFGKDEYAIKFPLLQDKIQSDLHIIHKLQNHGIKSP